MKPVDGQIVGDSNELLNELQDLKGKKLKFKKDEEIKDDLVYEAEGSDGKMYRAQLQKKNLIVTVYVKPKTKKEKEVKEKEPKEKKEQKELKEIEEPTKESKDNNNNNKKEIKWKTY